MGYYYLHCDCISGHGEGVIVVNNNTVNITQVFPPTMLDCTEFGITVISSEREKCKARFMHLYLSPNAATEVENIEQVGKTLTLCVSVDFPTFILGDLHL